MVQPLIYTAFLPYIDDFVQQILFDKPSTLLVASYQLILACHNFSIKIRIVPAFSAFSW